MPTLPDPLVLIGGSPRSGTTLVRNMLAAHPLVAVPDESYFIPEIPARLARVGRPGDLTLAWKLIRSHRFFVGWELDPAVVDEALVAHPPASYGDLLRALFDAFARSRGKPWSADKTTSHAERFSWLSRLFPASGIVHVIRDPREATMSLAVQHWQYAEEGGLGLRSHRVAAAATLWVRHVGEGRRGGSRLGSRYLEVRYEDLVSAPGRELARICELAGVDFDAGMLDYYGRGGDVLPEQHHTRSRQAPAPGARRWQEEMDPRDVAVIERIAGPLMEQVGYPRVTTRAGLREVAAVTASRLDTAAVSWVRNANPVLHRLRSKRR